jgi:hypothetical protein
MKYYITEHATYEVEAESPRAALGRFMAELTAPFPVNIDHREMYDENQNDVSEEAGDE